MTSWGVLLIVLFVGLGMRRSAAGRHRPTLVAAGITTVVLLGVALRQHTL